MQVNEAINLIRSGDDLSFAQIKEAHDALAGRFSDTADFARLTAIANRKIKQIDNTLFGMSLDEAIAAAEVVKTFTPKEQRRTEEFEKFLGKIEDHVSELKAEEKPSTEAQDEGSNEARSSILIEEPSASQDEAEPSTLVEEPLASQNEAEPTAEDELPSLDVINRNYESISKVVDKISCIASKMLPSIVPSAPTPRIREVPKVTIP